MITLKNMKMKPKLIMLFLLVGILPLTLVGWWGSRLVTNALMTKAYQQLESVREIKKAQIEKFFAERQGDMGVLIETVSTLRREAVTKLEAVQEIKKAQLLDYFATLKAQLRLLKDDPYVMNALTEFTRVFKEAGNQVDTLEWNALAEKYDLRMKGIMQDNGWHDIFLIHTNGDIVYTVARESDLGMIIPESDLKDQGIGKAFEAAKKMDVNDIAFTDLAPYFPSGGIPAGFMMAQMRDERGYLKGYLAFQIPLEKINEIMLRRDGMGKTGESYLVGQDGFMRSDSYFDPEGHSVVASFANTTRVETEAVRQALVGNEGQNVISDYRGQPVLSCWDPVDLGNGVRWAMMSEIDVAEAFNPVDEDGNEFYTRFKELYDYYDLFLMNPDGYAFYTVEKELDYQTNLISGKYSSSNLGRLVQTVLKTKQFGMVDFEPYAPSNDEPAAFIAQPVIRDDKPELVVALQLSLDAISSIMQEREGMGTTGETYLVGADKLMRSDSYLDPENHSIHASFADPEKGSVDTDAVKEALAGKTDAKIVIDYNDDPVLSAYTPIKVGDTTWALLAEIDKAEVERPIKQLLRSLLIIGLIMAGIVVTVGLAFSQGIMKQLGGDPADVADITNKIADGDLSVRFDTHGKSAEGLMASMQQMTEKINDVLTETDILIQAVQGGRLDTRGRTEGFSGGWRDLVMGMNNVIDAFMAPFNVTAEYLDRLSKGDLPEKIREDYQGDFREVTNNLNQCIDAISGLVAETGNLTEAAVEGKLDVRGDAAQFGGEYAAIIAGVNNTIDTLVGHIDQLPVPVMILDPEFSIRYINKAGAKMVGMSKEQLVGQKCYDQFKMSDCQSANCACARAMRSGNIETGDTEAHPDGKDLLISYNGLPIRDQAGTIIGAVEILMDQTEIKQAMSAVEQQNWLRTGQAELSNLMRGEQDAVTLAKIIITYLAKYLEVQTGAMYLITNQNGEPILQLSGSYAYAWRKGLNNAFRLGEGFVGQAALEQESIGYTDIPDDYLSVGSGLGATKPKYVLVTPFMYEGDLKGVIEVGATEKLSETQLEFLNQAAETIAVAFHSAQTRQKMQDLLEQTQRQTEELQAQQEHVREQG